MGGVIITPTRGMGEPTYRLPRTRCCPMRLGGLLLAVGVSVPKTFAGHSGLCCVATFLQ